MRAVGRPLAAGLLLLFALAPAALAGAPPAPDPHTQPLTDGCQRNPIGLLTYTSPEWTYVYRPAAGAPEPPIFETTSTAQRPHLAGGDLPQGHDSYDFNLDIRLPPADASLGGIGWDGLHTEREQDKLPPYARPTDKDAVDLWGRWVWDCGHWDDGGLDPDYFTPGSGQTPFDQPCPGCGESTEFHPVLGYGVRRDNPYLPQVGETETDFFLSSDGTVAGAQARCAKKHPAPSIAAYGPDYTACVNNPAEMHERINLRDYRFFVPAPPKPDPTSRMRYRVVASGSHKKAPEEIVVPRGDEGIDVTVPMNGFGNATETLQFAKRFFVGWEGPVQRIPAHVIVHIKSITIHRSLDPNPDDLGVPPTSSGVPPAEWNMMLDANGFWQDLNEWAPGMLMASDEQTFTVNREVALNVAEGGGVRLRVFTRECDLPKISPCPATPEVATDNDNPGTGDDAYPSVDAAVGNHVMKPNENWSMEYSVRKVSDATVGVAPPAPPGGEVGGPGPPGESPPVDAGGVAGAGFGCFDTFSPTSRFSRRGQRASRRGAVLRGGSSDRDCEGSGRLKRVSVAFADRVHSKGGCRFLERNRRFGPRRSCKKPTFVAVSGRSRWRLVVRRKLRKGRYVAWARAQDAAGNVELPDPAVNLIRFRVR